MSNCYDVSNKTELETPILKAVSDVKRSVNGYYIPPLVRIKSVDTFFSRRCMIQI